MLEKKFSPFYEKTVVSDSISLHDALENITSSGLLILCIVSAQSKKFVGVMTDSDIRKALLEGASLLDNIRPWINKEPVVATDNLSFQELSELSYRVGKREIPLLNLAGELTDIFVLGIYDKRVDIEPRKIITRSDYSDGQNMLPNFMFIQAGGLGSRLKSITNDKPKPLALVGGKPIIETLIQCAVQCGIQNYYVATNYLAEQIESFLSTKKFDKLNLKFIREEKFLGTAGAIGFIKNELANPVIVCNADVLSKVQFHKLLAYHEKHGADCTVVLRPHQMVVPYGVAQVKNNCIQSVTEKPKFDFMVNAGIYVLSSKICQEISVNEYLDMPEFLSQQLAQRKTVIPYYLYEYWIDIGRPDDYHKANIDYPTQFLDVTYEQ